jgi:hypothetical protein
MIAMKLRGNLCAALLVLVATTACAQDFSATTQIFDVTKPAEPKRLGRSMSLFHAGKVYDSINASQLTIYEPAQERFVIIDQSSRLKTVLSFDEIDTVLQRDSHLVEQKLVTLHGSASRAEKHAATLMKFQLRPRFEKEEYNAAKRTLVLTNKESQTYTVQCEPAASADIVKTYLEFANWAARLNYVVNPQVQLPGPRLELNKALLKHNVLPSRVELEWHQAGRLRLKAEHKFTWKLSSQDRESIHNWEQLLHAPDIKQVDLVKLLESSQSLALKTSGTKEKR